MLGENHSSWRVSLVALLAVLTGWGCGPREEEGTRAEASRRVALQTRSARAPARSVLTTGQFHSLALHADGTVWGWGGGGYGRIGDGTSGDRPSPVRVSGLTDVVAVSSTAMDSLFDEHSLAVRKDGTVWAWGGNYFGQLGDGTRQERAVPMQVAGLTEVESVSAASSYSLAVRADGTAWAWGANYTGQLGDGTKAWRARPVRVAGLTDVVAVAGGFYHSLALREDGTVWAWGSNDQGQLGDGTTTSRLTPGQVVGLTDVVALGAGFGFSVALRADGTVWAWGANHTGVGDGTEERRLTPVRLPGLTEVVALSVGSRHALALRADGTVWGWGSNYMGQLGPGQRLPGERVPVPLPGVDGVVAMAAGSWQSLLLRQDGTLWALGYNSKNQLGTGSGARFSPVRVHGLEGAASATAGLSLSVAARQDGTVWLWGDDTYSFPYNPEVESHLTPVPVAGLTEVERVALGRTHSLALRRDGTVWGWGSNRFGELGDGTNTARATPAPVVGLTDVKALVVDFSNSGYALALRRDGSVWAWGANTWGQLGDGTTLSRNTPVRVLEDVVALTANFGQALAVRTDGTVLSWGWDSHLGARVTPTPVPGVTGAVAVAIGQTPFAVRADGTVLSWPYALHRVPAGGTVDASLLPAPVPGLTGVVSVSTGNAFTLALRADGTVLSWGRNVSGVLGRETDALNNPLPAPVPGLTDVVSLSAGDAHAVAVRADGSVWSWGRNDSGQIGDGISPLHTTPARVLLPCRFVGLPSLEERNAPPARCGG